jgi:ubiquinone biosynthesis protein
VKLLALFTRKGRLRFARYRDILFTLLAHGFGEIVYQTGLGRALRLVRRLSRRARAGQRQQSGEFTTWERIRMTIEELGPTFIKLGQILSNRPDLIPRELQMELEKLQENVPPFPGDQAASFIENELGSSMQKLFREFDREPVAAASIAQLHHAVLPSGETVAVKVQRPGLLELVSVDVEILRELAGLVERYFPASQSVGPRDLVDEFERAIYQELDFRREAASIERFGSQFADDDRVMVPRVYREYSTQKVLTMEFVDGRPLADLLNEDPRDVEEGKRVAELGADLTLKQIFQDGFFHADPHPGNIFVLRDGRLCYLDFGLTGSLIRRDLEVISDMLISIIGRDEQKASRAVVRLAGSRDYDTARSIEREIAELIGRFQNAPAGEFSFTMLLSEIVGILVDKDLRLPPDLFLLVKSLITIEGVATALDPHLDFSAHLEPFAKELVKDEYDPQRVASRFATMAGDYRDLLEGLPGDYYKVVDRLASGKLRLSLEDESIQPIRRTILQATSALVFAVVLAALIVGSALIVHSRVPPLWNEIPVIGILGFVVAGLVGFWLLVRIIRNDFM